MTTSTPSSQPAQTKAEHNTQFFRQVLSSFDFTLPENKISTEQDKLDIQESIQSFALHFLTAASSPSSDASLEDVQKGLNVLWKMFLSTATILSKDDAYQDKLLTLLLWTKEFDSLCKRLHPSSTPTTTWESYGLPDALQNHWEGMMGDGSIEQLENLAAFSGKCLTVGICGDEIGRTALCYLSSTLENEDADEGETKKMLPAAVVWIENARHKLLAFSASDQFSPSDQGDTKNPNDLMLPRPLAEKTRIDQPGYSMKRWLYWRKRFQSLSKSLDVDMAKVAKKGFMAMITCGREFGIEVEGEERFKDRLQKVMHAELVRKIEQAKKEGKEEEGISFGVEEVDVDIDWVE